MNLGVGCAAVVGMWGRLEGSEWLLDVLKGVEERL